MFELTSVVLALLAGCGGGGDAASMRMEANAAAGSSAAVGASASGSPDSAVFQTAEPAQGDDASTTSAANAFTAAGTDLALADMDPSTGESLMMSGAPVSAMEQAVQPLQDGAAVPPQAAGDTEAPRMQAAAVTGKMTASDHITTAAADMSLRHEVIPLGVRATVGWKYMPSVAMNVEPYASALPSYWKGIRYAEWRALVPWFVVYEGEPSNPAKNVQVEISGIEAWAYLESTRKWRLLGSSAKPVWDSIYAPNAVDLISFTTSKTTLSDAVRYSMSSGQIIHGGLGQIDTPWSGTAADIRAIYIQIRHRLAVKDSSKPDDRAVANIGLQVGMDYYPWKGAKLSDLAASYVPGAGGGRFRKVGTDWQYSTLLLRKPGVSILELTGESSLRLSY